uniref:Twinfilin n=1 Tax=Panstrongylus lignarius TaxID=156445 RepID=A0A224XSC9_9HEMI
MSHQTGIKANEKLKKFFAKNCHSSKIRIFKVCIENEELTLAQHIEAKGTWEDDFDKHVHKLIELDQPSYIMCRFDSKNSTGYDWLLVSWSPDDAPVRQKMLYASTKATLKQEFGSGQIQEEVHATTLEELTAASVRKIKDAPAPLSPQEEEALMSQVTDGMRHVGIESRGATLNTLNMPLSDQAKEGLAALAAEQVNYVRLAIDILQERIDVDMTSVIQAKELGTNVPEDTARYHVFRYQYKHDGQDKKAIVFIYSMPGYSCPIKERMLYSSSKAPLIETVESILGVKVDKKMEVDSGKEVSEECLYEALNPAEDPVATSTAGVTQKKFDKPKGPPNRGAKRLTKSHHQCSVLD